MEDTRLSDEVGEGAAAAGGGVGRGYYEDYWSGEGGWTPDSGVDNEDEAGLFRDYLREGMVLIDYGCGNCERYGKQMGRRGLSYLGFDISEAALEHARGIGMEVGKIGEDGGLPVAEGSADAAICFEVLEHLVEPERALGAIRRALGVGGVGLFSVPNAAFIWARLEFLVTGFWNPGGSPLTARARPWSDPHIRFYNPRLLRRMVEACGFEVVETRSQAFTFAALPVVYRLKRWRGVVRAVSLPFGWLGKVFPGLFSPRLFVVVRKAVDSGIRN
jgi:SAM-dependent methyltransferase